MAFFVSGTWDRELTRGRIWADGFFYWDNFGLSSCSTVSIGAIAPLSADSSPCTRMEIGENNYVGASTPYKAASVAF